MKNGKKIIGFIVAILVLGIATFAGVYTYLTKTNPTEKVVVIEETFHDVGEIFVNLSDENAKRYVKLKLSISFDETNEELKAEIEKKHAVMRDIAIYYFKTCSAKDFEATNETILKGELIKRLNQKLTKGVILNILVDDLIVQ